MANLKQLRRRISGVRSTQQLTRAMKLVAAAKLRRAQEGVEDLRPYSESLDCVIRHMAHTDGDEGHPLLARRELRRFWLVVLTSDKGLCGTFNANVLRAVEVFLKGEGARYDSCELLVVGRKGNDYLSRRGAPIRRYYEGVASSPTYASATRLGEDIAAAFAAEEVDGVQLVFNEFRSAMVQTQRRRPLLPLPEITAADTVCRDATGHIFEPDRTTVMDRLLPLYVNIEIYQALLESLASEMGARMTAMDNATNNAADLIERLTLQYNKARQETITNELMDIVGGAEALNG
ncbi:MAG: ATP synthase F1 subunit gamma [Deltaproteobacteria bacterium]|nr:ATP synthase F1 subunit gamma [Deltaproteobacteria bacterium]